MPLIQKRKKLNDFLVGRDDRYYGNTPIKHALTMTRAVLIRTTASTRGGTFYSEISPRGNMIYVYHIEKRRPRWMQVNRNKMVDGRRATVSERVHMKHWKVRLFAFPCDMVKRVQQHARHFTIELK